MHISFYSSDLSRKPNVEKTNSSAESETEGGPVDILDERLADWKQWKQFVAV